MKKTNIHLSDCAIYNEPAYPKGKCNCGYEFNSIDKIIKQIEKCNFESVGGYLKNNIAYGRLKWLLYQIGMVFTYQLLHLHLNYTENKREKNRFLIVSKTVDNRWDTKGITTKKEEKELQWKIVTELNIISEFEEMCEESLPPNEFEMFNKVQITLKKNRKLQF